MTDRARDGSWRRRVEEIFEEALSVPRDERERVVSRRCGDDSDMAEAVHRLLEAHEREEGILDRPGAPGLGLEPQGGDRFGPYRVQHLLGRGGMGHVYLAVREDAFMRRVALKVLSVSGSDESAVRRFEGERQIMASLSHPNIAQLLDGGVTESGTPYLAMEYVEGLPLLAYADRERLTLAERLVLFLKVCDAVQHAHRSLVIHRDLKPSNILVTPQGEPKLLDFGIAKLQQAVGTAAQPVTHPDHRALTPEYASPEQLRGEPLTTSSDIFSLGVLLYELLAGAHPFRERGLGPAELVRAICERDPVAPSAVVPCRSPDDGTEATGPSARRRLSVGGLQARLRGDLDAIVLRALRKEPGRRYASVEGLASDLRRFLVGEPVQARGDARAYRVRKFVSRHKVEAVAATAAIAALLVGLAGAVWQADTAERERERAQRALEQAEASSAFLLGLFDVETGGMALADSITARDLLERGLASLEALDPYPELRARLLSQLGHAYRSVGSYAEAAEHLRAAAEADERAVGDTGWEPDHARAAARTLAELAEVLRLSGAYAEALATAERAHRIRVAGLGERDPDVATSLIQIAGLHVYFGDFEAADSLTRAALELRRAELGPSDPSVTAALEVRASIIHREGRLDESEALLRDAVARRRSEGPESLAHATALLRLATFLSEERGALEEAEALCRRILLIAGPDNPERPAALAALAEIMARQGRWSEARDTYEEAIALRRSALGSDHASVADLLYGFGLVLTEAGDWDAADTSFRESLEIWERRLGPDHAAMGYALTGLSRTAELRGDLDRAEVLARQALALRRDAYEAGHALIGESEIRLAAVLLARGDVDEAEALLLEGLASLGGSSERASSSPEIRKMHQALADLYGRRGDAEEAARHRALAGGPPPD